MHRYVTKIHRAGAQAGVSARARPAREGGHGAVEVHELGEALGEHARQQAIVDLGAVGMARARDGLAAVPEE